MANQKRERQVTYSKLNYTLHKKYKNDEKTGIFYAHIT